MKIYESNEYLVALHILAISKQTDFFKRENPFELRIVSTARERLSSRSLRVSGLRNPKGTDELYNTNNQEQKEEIRFEVSG